MNAVENGGTIRIFGEFFVLGVELLLDGVDGAAGSDVIPNCEIAVAWFDDYFLGQEANTNAFERNFTVIKRLLSENNAKKGGFASAIDADDADFVAGFDMKIAVIVDDVGTVSKFEMGCFHRNNYNRFLGFCGDAGRFY